MTQSLIIGYYKNLPFLSLVLESIEKQNYRNFEVIIAEDDNSLNLDAILEGKKFTFPIKHISQPDNGFQKNKILNEAIKISNGEQLIFIDMDCLLHPNFLFQYAKRLKPGYYGSGRRAELSKPLTNSIIKNGLKGGISYIKMVIWGCKRVEDAIYFPAYSSKKERRIIGSNWGIMKSDLLSINGFDEDYVTAGVGEDVDLEWRLKKSGINGIDMKYHSIQYHLDHPVHYNRATVLANMSLMETKVQFGNTFCLNGIIKAEPTPTLNS